MKILVQWIIVVAVLFAATTAQAQTTLQDSLFAWYPFSGNTLDSSGNGHDGAGGGLVPAADRFGRANRAYAFDGSTSYLRSNTVLPDLNEFTVAWWMVSDNPSQACVLLDGDAVLYRDLFISVEGNQIRFRCDKTGQVNVTNAVTFANNQQWTHVVCTVTPDSLWMYVNDTLKLATSGSFAEIGYHTFFEIGRVYDYVGQQGSTYFHGLLDDIRIYTRRLRPNEVTQLYTEQPVAVAQSLKKGLTLAPNPSPGRFTLYGLQGPHRLQVVNSQGQVIQTISVTSPNPVVSLDGVPPGVYTLRIVGNGGVSVAQVVKE